MPYISAANRPSIDEKAATLADEIATAMFAKRYTAELHCKASAR